MLHGTVGVGRVGVSLVEVQPGPGQSHAVGGEGEVAAEPNPLRVRPGTPAAMCMLHGTVGVGRVGVSLVAVQPGPGQSHALRGEGV